MEETPTEFVRRVRRQTCYSSLRGVIRICALFGYAIGVLFIAVTVWSLYQRAANPETGSENLQPQTISLIVAIAVFILTAAAHQASILLIDISDTLIEQARPKGSPTEKMETPKASAPYRIPGI